MQPVQPHPRQSARHAELSDQQCVEGVVEGDERAAERERGPDGPGEHRERGERAHHRADPVSPAAVERGGDPPRAELERHPRRPSAGDVRPQHRAERPPLEVGALDRRIEPEPASGHRQPVTQLDVLDRRVGVPGAVEAADLQEVCSAHGPEPAPERLAGPAAVWCTWWWSRLRNIETVPRAVGRVVVGAVQRRELRVVREGRPDPTEGVRVHLDVGIDEDEHVPGCPAGAGVAGIRCGEGGGSVDDDDLVGGIRRRRQRRVGKRAGWRGRRSPVSPRSGCSRCRL